MVFFVLGWVLLGVSLWGWIGFIMAVRMRESFNIATPSEFLSMSIIGLGCVVVYWMPLLALLLIIVGMVAGFVLHRILRFVTRKRYLSISDEEMEEYIKERYNVSEADERKKNREAKSIPDFVSDPLYGMVQVMCTSYFAYMARWKDTYGESSFRPIYAARYALYSRNPSWSISRLNSFLAEVSSFRELLLAICAEPDEMPDRVDELHDWLEHQNVVNIPSCTWSKQEAVESKIGSGENHGF